MTPKQKRRLEELASDAYGMNDRDCIRMYHALNDLAAESTPKCGTCGHYDREADMSDDYVTFCKRHHNLGARYLNLDVEDIATDFGCVLHSDYEETP